MPTLEEQDKLMQAQGFGSAYRMTGVPGVGSVGMSTNIPSVNQSLASQAQGANLGLSGGATKEIGTMGLSPLDEKVMMEKRASQETMDRNTQIASQQQSYFQAQRNQINEAANTQKQTYEEQQKQAKDKIAAVQGSQSQGLGFSSATAGAIQYLEDKHATRIKNLEAARQKALDSADLQMFTTINERIAQAELDKDDQIGKVLNRIATEKNNTLADLSSFASSGKAFTDLDPQTRSTLAGKLGYSENDLGLIYQGMQKTSKQFTSVSAGSSIYDSSGKLIATAPSKPEDNAPKTEKIGNDLYQWNAGTQTWDKKIESPQEDKVLTPSEAAALNVPYGTTMSQAKGLMPKAQLTGTEKIDTELKLAKQFQQINKENREAQRQIGMINTAFEEAQKAQKAGKSINAASQGVLVAFQKLLDPNSVVRESEYARSPEGLSFVGRLEGMYTKFTQGGAGLTANDLQEFVNVGNQFLKNYETQQNDFVDLVKTQSDSYGLNIKNIVGKNALETSQKAQENDPFAGIDFSTLDISDF